MINIQNFLLTEIPKFIPESSNHIAWWKEQKRRCVEGYWIGGRYMAGPLYFYVNFWTIKLKKSKNSKNEVIAKPFLRDLEWEKANILMEVKGFSGFSLDKEFTANYLFSPLVREENEKLGIIPKTNLKFMSPRDYLRRNFTENLGKPLYENNCKNVMDLESRGGGKSYWAAGAMIAHNFLFDGATDYDEYLKAKQTKELISSETLVGSIDSKYSTNLLDKFSLGLGELPGKMEYNGEFYNSPLYLENKGSLTCNRYIEAVREIQRGKNWVTEGSRSKIHHRSFQDNPLAGNGTRPNAVLIEEVGFHYNLTDSLGALKDCTMNGSSKFGYIWMFGTGGDNEGKGAAEMKKVFYNPDNYDCLVFEDLWENRGKICYFVPVWKTLNEYKNDQGETKEDLATRQVEEDRKKAKSDPKTYLDEITNRPMKPSEAFMTTNHNIFPVSDLQDNLAELETVSSLTDGTWNGRLSLDKETGRVIYKLTDDKPIVDFPLGNNKNAVGCIQIFEHPYDDEPEKGIYLSGCDTYDDDESETDSLGNIWIMNSITRKIVAEYTGRPKEAKDFYEICRRLLMYYNGLCNYENNKKGLYAYFENHNCLHYLADTPKILRDVENTTFYENGNKSKGTNATESVNKYHRSLTRSWLIEQAYGAKEGINNARTLRNIAFIKELINYYPKGNFDRISGFGMLMLLLQDRYKIITSSKEDENKNPDDDFFSRNWKENSYMEQDFPSYFPNN